MKDQQEIRIAWVIWHLLFHLNDRLWDYYEKEFLELSGNPEELMEIDLLIADVKGCDLPF
jgi:hypothetical protein